MGFGFEFDFDKCGSGFWVIRKFVILDLGFDFDFDKRRSSLIMMFEWVGVRF